MKNLLALLILLSLTAAAPAAEPVTLSIGYIQRAERLLSLSRMARPTPDLGLAGAALAIDDNNTTGRFTGQTFVLSDARAGSAAEAVAALETMADAGVKWIVADLPRADLVALTDAAAAREVLVFNAGARDDELRNADCRANLIHTAPSRTMLADALAQYLALKRWTRWFLVVGSHPDDEQYAAALRRAAERFGATIEEERAFTDAGGARTTDSGHVQVQAQMPVFLQGAAEHDVVVVADESEVFAAYVPFHTWEPRPVAGSAGLTPTAWAPEHEQWGAVQIQNRFSAKAARPMREPDMLAWMAVRAVGEGATRAASGDPAVIEAYLKGDKFQLAAFKGEALSLRDWDLQLRQPVLLADGSQVVSVSPQEGFLHPTSFLDTLGYDRPESTCRLQ